MVRLLLVNCTSKRPAGGRGAEPGGSAALCLEPAAGEGAAAPAAAPTSLPSPPPTRRWAHSGQRGAPPVPMGQRWGGGGARSGAAAVRLSQEVVRTVQKGRSSERSVPNRFADAPQPHRSAPGCSRGGEGVWGHPMGLGSLRTSVKCCRRRAGGGGTPRERQAELRAAPPGLYCFGEWGAAHPLPPFGTAAPRGSETPPEL